MGFGVPLAEAGVRESPGSALEGTPAMQNLRSTRTPDPCTAAAGAEHTGETPVLSRGAGTAREKRPQHPPLPAKIPSWALQGVVEFRAHFP